MINIFKNILKNEFTEVSKETEDLKNKIDKEKKDRHNNDNKHEQKEKKIQDWNLSNVDTLYNWLVISSYNIMILERTIEYYRKILRIFTISGLVLSSLTGTISVSQLTQSSNSLILNYIFTFMSYSITALTGALKIYRIQEKLEDFIKIKQEWISFSTSIVSQMQLPLKMRQEAEDIIQMNKIKYLELLKLDLEIPQSIKEGVIENMRKQYDYYGEHEMIRPALTDIIMGVASKELFISKNNENRKMKNLKKEENDLEIELESELDSELESENSKINNQYIVV
jgi:hypothetical protein